MTIRDIERYKIQISSMVFVLFLLFIYFLFYQRYFALDEFQYMTATTLTARGMIPYRDFFEYHTPLSYMLHAPFFIVNWLSFPMMALLFRMLMFFHFLINLVMMIYYFNFKFDSVVKAILYPIVVFSITLGTLSLVEYRADNLMALYLVSSLFLLEINSRKKSKLLSLLIGLLVSISILFTQKAILYAGGIYSFLLIREMVYIYEKKQRFFFHIKKFFIGLFIPLFIFFIYLVLSDSAQSFWTFVFVDGALHEKLYPPVHFTSYLDNYLSLTKVSIIGYLFLISLYFSKTKNSFWGVVLFISLAGLALTRAQFPHNFVLISIVLGIISVMGINYLIEAKESFNWRLMITFLICLMVLNQTFFLFNKYTNKHQLKLYEKLERMSNGDDRYIDNSGAGVFLRPANFHYLHGAAHRILYRKKFEENFVKEYRDSAARFLIKDSRYVPYVRDYIESLYIPLDGSLMVYGKVMKFSNSNEQKIEVLKDGEYFFFSTTDLLNLDYNFEKIKGLKINGEEINSNVVNLKKGNYDLFHMSSSENIVFSSVDIKFFKQEIGNLPHGIINHY